MPTHSPLLRMAAVRDGFDADVTDRPGRARRSSWGWRRRWAGSSTRNRVPLTHEMAGRGELAFRLPVGSAFFRPRVDVFRNWRRR